MRVFTKIVIFLWLGSGMAALRGQSAEEIVRELDRRQSFSTVESRGSMITRDRFGTKTSEFISWSKGDREFLVEFTSAAEAGQKVLRTPDALFLYFPDAEEIIRLQGAALRQSMLGSDISYEDMTEGNDTLEKYAVRLLREEQVDGRECYVIDMTARKRSVPYPRQTLWVEKERLLPYKAHYFSRSGKLLKEMRVEEVRAIGDKFFLTRMILEDRLKRNSSTELIIDEVETDLDLAGDFFSLDSLSW